MKGWVYVITNKAMPGLVKVGYSMKDPEIRAEELNHTGAPHPYQVKYEVLVEEPRAIERAVHKQLQSQGEGKEWFRCSTDEAAAAIRFVVGSGTMFENYKCADLAQASDLGDRKHALWDKELPVPPGATQDENGYVKCLTCGRIYWPTYKHRCSIKPR